MWFVQFLTGDFESMGKTAHPDLMLADHFEPCLISDGYTENMGSSVNGTIPNAMKKIVFLVAVWQYSLFSDTPISDT